MQYLSVLILLAVSCSLPRSAAASSLEPVLSQDGRLMYSDHWGRSPVREVDPRERVNVLGTTMGLEPGGTNLEMRLMVAFIGPGTADAPRGFSGTLDVQVRSSADETTPRNIIGELPSFPVSLQPGGSRRFFNAIKHSVQSVDSSRSLYLYELTLRVPLRRPLTDIPEFVSICSGMYGELVFLRITRRTVEPPVQPTPVVENRGLSAALKGAARLGPPAPSSSGLPAAVAPLTTRAPVVQAPEVRLSIIKEKDYFLITCSPVLTNAILEETSLAPSPWQWHPVMTGSNARTPGWYVPPDDGARAFRLRIPTPPGQ